jgi:hypothetical protein
MSRGQQEAQGGDSGTASSYTMKADCANCGRTHVYDFPHGKPTSAVIRGLPCKTCGCCNALTNPRKPDEEKP